jgi:hypothetical protein
MKFAIKSEKFKHQDQIIELDFSEIKVLPQPTFLPQPTSSNWGGIHFKSFFKTSEVDVAFSSQLNFDVDKYNGKSVWGKYLGSSRIDGFPMFEIDTSQLDREDKIFEVLK